jgi:protein-disulfide isomerase
MMAALPEFDQRRKLMVKKHWMGREVENMKKILLVAVVAMAGAGASVRAQTPAPPVMSPATAQAQQAAEPQAPAPQAPTPNAAPAAPVNPFPPVNLKNFTADSPTTAEVNDFLKMLWGYNDDISWSIAAIQKTAAPGVARVVVLVANKAQSDKVSQSEFFVTPDGKHAIAGAVIDFGEKPYADRRQTMQDQANGPAEGAANKDLLLVEFVDLLNPKSKQAQDVINNLVKDIPQTRLVFESLPADGSPYAALAAAEGVCVRKAKGDAAFFTYAQTVFGKQQGLTAATLQPALNAAVTAAGADPKSIATCAASQTAKDDVKASVALAAAAGVDGTPTLVVNGRVLPIESIPYETLKQVVAYQGKLDGLTVHVQPTLSTLK